MADEAQTPRTFPDDETPRPDEEGGAPPTSTSELALALKKLSACSLRNEDVKEIRGGADDADGDGRADNDDEEPEITTRKEAKEWRKWAKKRAKAHADRVHPRLQQKDGPPKKLPLSARPNDVLEQVGIVPALYLDFLKFGGGYCLLGLVLAAIPSCVFAFLHASEVYDRALLSGYPGVFLYLTIGARSECGEPVCQMINLLTAILEVVFSLLLLLGTIHFRKRALQLQQVNDANNVYTREYAVQLHGMPKRCTAEEVRAHVEQCLQSHGKIKGGGDKAHKVWDVALITDCANVLKQALRQAPLERKWTILDRKLNTLRAFKKEKDTGWGINQKINNVAESTEDTAEKLLSVREKMTKKNTKNVAKVRGAFVTFEEQPAARACLKLFGGLNQKKEIKMKGRRLKAYKATQPRDLLHENLPYRVNALDLRALNTVLRRVFTKSFLGLFMALSFATIIAVNTLKQALMGGSQVDLDNMVPAWIVPHINTLLPALASGLVVGVNQAIVFLVGFLGAIERHPTVSGMHRSKIVTIFLGVAFNTGALPLAVSMALPERLLDLAYGDYEEVCNCPTPRFGLFCCAVGQYGVFARGPYLTMTKGWHRDVGTLMVGTLFVQALVGLVVWIGPCVGASLKRVAKAGGAMHVFDMEALWEGPEIDLPKFIGKAYAFYICAISYAAVMPVLYPIGVIFFVGTWTVERYALLRVHRTPPPYSFELITSTLGWMPWAVCFHLAFAFWGFASLPSAPFLSSVWIPPFSGMGRSDYGSGVDAEVILLEMVNSTSVLGETLEGLDYVWDLDGHVNSLPCLVLFVPAVLLLVYLIFMLLRSTPLYIFLMPVEVLLCRSINGVKKLALRRPRIAGPRIAPGDAPKPDDAAGPASAWAEDAPADAPAPVNALADGLDAEDVIDPPFSKILEGVERTNVRLLDGAVVHEAQVDFSLTRCAKLANFTPTALIFRALGMHESIAPLTKEDWAEAEPVFTKLARAADISYQPEFHPTYEKAFVYMAEPGRLQAFIAAEAEREAKKNRPKRTKEDSSDDDDDDDDDDDESEEDDEKKQPGQTKGKAPANKQGGDDLAVEDIADEKSDKPAIRGTARGFWRDQSGAEPAGNDV